MGTRNSKLARYQAEWVAGRLRGLGQDVELVPITTTGDQKSGPLSQFGGVGLFTKEIQKALIEHHIDLAVHSLKDLPTAPIPGLTIAAVPERASVHDALVGASIARLVEGARVGTGSPRRKTQLLHLRPDLDIRDIRGNVDTRLSLIDEGKFDAIVLACAGLERLGFEDRIGERLPCDIMMPAAGQGALGIETRAEDTKTIEAVCGLNDVSVFRAVTAERHLLNTLQAGCLAPIGATAEVTDGQLLLRSVVVSVDGSKRLSAESQSDDSSAIAIAERVADQLLSQGAGDLIAAAHGP